MVYGESPKKEISLDLFEEAGVITSSEKNLRSKIASITRSLENLSEKKVRIDFEIKRQKESLTRKREELKKVTKRNAHRLQLSLEASESGSTINPETYQELQRYDSKLLRKSYELLETEAQ